MEEGEGRSDSKGWTGGGLGGQVVNFRAAISERAEASGSAGCLQDFGSLIDSLTCALTGPDGPPVVALVVVKQRETAH